MPDEKMPAAIDGEAMRLLVEVEEDGGGDGFVAELVELFLSETDKREQNMRRGVEDGDWETVGRMAHAVKGSCGHFGAHRLTDLCVTMETAAGAGLSDEARRVFDEIGAEILRVKTALEPYRSGAAGDGKNPTGA